jgi:hypothetical protein
MCCISLERSSLSNYRSYFAFYHTLALLLSAEPLLMCSHIASFSHVWHPCLSGNTRTLSIFFFFFCGERLSLTSLGITTNELSTVLLNGNNIAMLVPGGPDEDSLAATASVSSK